MWNWYQLGSGGAFGGNQLVSSGDVCDRPRPKELLSADVGTACTGRRTYADRPLPMVQRVRGGVRAPTGESAVLRGRRSVRREVVKYLDETVAGLWIVECRRDSLPLKGIW